MTMLLEAFHRVRAWAGLADVSETRLTPGFGWLLPAPVEARRQPVDPDATRAVSRDKKDVGA